MSAVILFLAFAVSISKAFPLLYDPYQSILPSNNLIDDDYNDSVYGYNGNNGFQNDLRNADNEKLLAMVLALIQQSNSNVYNPYSPFTDLFTFKGNRGKNRIGWRKWLNWNKQQAKGVNV